MIGRRIDSGTRSVETGEPVLLEIVGVIGDLRSGRVTDALEPQVYFTSTSPTTFYVRGTRPAEDLMNAVRDTAARVAPSKPITNLQTMEQQFRANIAIERFFAGSSTAFAVLATALAALGLYGVLAYSVAQRSREIGLRYALGAPAARIRGMVMRQMGGIAVIGVTVGALAAAFVGRAARSLLFGVEVGDPLVLVGAAAVLMIVMLGAAYIPARRAALVDPMVALRYE